MSKERLTQLEHVAQLLNFQIRNVHTLIEAARYTLDLAQLDLQQLMVLHKEWGEENGFSQETQE